MQFPNGFEKSNTVEVHQLDLKGQGIRGMEYIPAMGGFVLISGSVTKKGKFGLWLWKFKRLEKLENKVFDQLCRPESVIPWGDTGFAVISEQSGSECSNSASNFVVFEPKR